MRRIFCIGRNYGEHIKELGNSLPAQTNSPSSPIIFMKPESSLIFNGESSPFPTHGQDLHHEIEVVIEVSGSPKEFNKKAAIEIISGVTLGIDLTLRDIQAELKKQGLPWEKAKSFDGSALIGVIKEFKILDPEMDLDLNNIDFSLEINGVIKQKGNTKEMLLDIPSLILEINKIWKLRPGDLIYTGTPQGVGPLHAGDKIIAKSPQIGVFDWKII